MGVSESSLDDPESEEAGTGEWAGQTFHIAAPLVHCGEYGCTAGWTAC